MARVLFIALVLLFLPFLVYAAYVRVVRRVESENIWYDAPIVPLAIIGVALAVVGLIGMMSLTGF
jgi:hypothetical protein